MVLFFNLDKKFKNLKEEVKEIKKQLSFLDENINTRIVAEQKLNRQKLAVELLSKWSNNLDRPITSTCKIVDNLSEQQCKDIIKGEGLNIHERYKSLLEISLGKPYYLQVLLKQYGKNSCCCYSKNRLTS